jgi:uncharacterized protein (TIGR00299 family) protein
VVGWIDSRIGVAGDMLLGSCLAAGADLDAVRSAVAAVSDGFLDVHSSPVHRGGLQATSAHILISPDADRVTPRNLADIVNVLETADVGQRVRNAAIEVFTELAAAEAQCHGCAIAEVHFHELGAWDTIGDVVGVLTAWESLGWPRATASEIGVGSGVIDTAHGPLSVPGPAVATLLVRSGAPSQAGPLPMEAATPTGAALVAYLCEGRWGPQPAMTIRQVGLGAGDADPAGVANVTRVMVGTPLPGTGSADHDVVELTCNVDDLDPRLWPNVLASLLEDGALDCWHTGITMKQGRPARQLFVLCTPQDASAMRSAIFSLIPTLGVRWRLLQREVLDRHFIEVTVAGHRIAVKVGFHHGLPRTATPEWRDVERTSRALGIPAREVLAKAQSAALQATE